MDLDSINKKTVNIHFTAHQFWDEEGTTTLLMSVIEKLLFNQEGCYKLPTNAEGGKLSHKQHNFFNKHNDIETELSFVDSMFECGS